MGSFLQHTVYANIYCKINTFAELQMKNAQRLKKEIKNMECQKFAIYAQISGMQYLLIADSHFR